MKYLIYLILSLLIMSACSSVSTQKKTDSKIIMIANVKTNPPAAEVTENKVEAAMNIVTKLTGKYYLVPLNVRDSIARELKTKGIEPTAERVAKEIGAGQILFFNVRRLANILRTDITSVSITDNSTKSSGTGYAALRFRHMADEKPVFDPPLLEALQRAFAVSEKDSSMFASAEESFRVKPVDILVVGGLDYQDDETSRKWEIFEKKQVTSYDASEYIFQAASKSKNYVAFDIATRDSIYALFNLHMVENYRPPTVYEINALNKLQVPFYLTGMIKRTDEGAEVILYLCRVEESSLKVIDSSKGTLKEDNLKDLENLVMDLTGKLLKI